MTVFKAPKGSGGAATAWLTTIQNTTASIYNSQTATQTYNNTLTTKVINNNRHTTRTSSNGTFVQHFQSLADNIRDGLEKTHADVIGRVLKGSGYCLPDGSRLKLVDGKPLIEHRHTDGVEKLRPVPVSHYGTIDFSDADHFLGPGAVIKLPDGTILEIDHNGKLILETFINATGKVVNVTDGRLNLYESLAFCHFGDINLPEGADSSAVFTLPNGVTIKLFPDDHIEIDESNGRQLYKTEPVRGFNKFLNASDLLEEFIAYCGTQKVSRQDFAELPVSLFIYWLIVRAGEHDGDSLEESLPLLTHAVEQQRYKPSHCKCCGKFLLAKLVKHDIKFCSADHMQRYLDKVDL